MTPKLSLFIKEHKGVRLPEDYVYVNRDTLLVTDRQVLIKHVNNTLPNHLTCCFTRHEFRLIEKAKAVFFKDELLELCFGTHDVYLKIRELDSKQIEFINTANNLIKNSKGHFDSQIDFNPFSFEHKHFYYLTRAVKDTSISMYYSSKTKTCLFVGNSLDFYMIMTRKESLFNGLKEIQDIESIWEKRTHPFE